MFILGPLNQFDIMILNFISYGEVMNGILFYVVHVDFEELFFINLTSNFVDVTFQFLFFILFFIFTVRLFSVKNKSNFISLLYYELLNLLTNILDQSKETSSLTDKSVNYSGRLGTYFFNYFCTIVIFLILSNLCGLIPFGFTLTSHFILTLSLSLAFFVAINIEAFYYYQKSYFNIFLPGGTPFLILPLIVPIEIISYFSRIFSLSIRLFANMMSGHTLLFILTSFLFTLFFLPIFFKILNLIPLTIIFVITFMEFGIALLQVYVFSVLSNLYINDLTHPNEVH